MKLVRVDNKSRFMTPGKMAILSKKTPFRGKAQIKVATQRLKNTCPLPCLLAQRIELQLSMQVAHCGLMQGPQPAPIRIPVCPSPFDFVKQEHNKKLNRWRRRC